MTEEYAEAVKIMFEREAKEYQKKLDYWNSKKGQRVKHLTYLLTGVITDTMTLPLSSQPRIIVKWDNGAESMEIPVNIELLSDKNEESEDI